MGPAGGAAADWLWQTVAGLGAAGTTAGVGLVMRERTTRRKMVKAQDAYAADLEEAETDEDVAAIKSKHAARQDALGIRKQLTQERHA
jgi:cysteine synthase